MLETRCSGLLVALFSLSGLVACGYGDHQRTNDDGSYTPAPNDPSATIEQATIDTDELLDVEPGAGAGAFFEYEAGGTYHVTTSCDVASGSDCWWDIVVTPLDSAPIKSVSPLDLEEDDTLSFGATNQLRLVAYTGDDFDGFSFQTEPGAAVEVDVLLDEGAGNGYLFWVGDGALHSGAPSNPVDLVPSEK